MEVPVKKNKEYLVEIIDQGFEGEGIAKIEGFTIFIEGAIKGEKCRILIVKVTSSHAFGKLVEILEKSKYRVEPDCATYKRCGGCNLRHIDYEETLNIKQNTVQNLVNKTLNNKIKVEMTVGMGNPYNYRNKAQYPVGFDKSGEPVMGVYAKRTHEIIPMRNCMIQNPVSEKIANVVLGFFIKNNIPIYNEKNGEGLLRHIVIKVGIKTHEIMCILVLNKKELKKEKELIKVLIREFPEIKTIVKNYNMKNTNVILGNENEVIYGDGYIYDELGDYTFKISPLSFYQINPIQTEALYNIAIEMADLKKTDTLFDLYCGIGTIGIFASPYVNRVYGIEIVKQAIEDAKENANINNIRNIEFFAGDVEKVFENVLKEHNVKPDVIFVDPPRKGLDKHTIENILNIKPEKIVYISCNPASLVRDLKLLEESYEIKKIQPVDMFPFTSNVECCAVMELKNSL
ncbi:MAG TPA: 23S rRNA (uracil(1939)-C(5))-methyltransferase RlmD [Clostridiaceae bacterium]|nr:23S rRNA (uracil(1939)-C(5))-methyltransferase RlmD [Clostridiaceae bacterium]